MKTKFKLIARIISKILFADFYKELLTIVTNPSYGIISLEEINKLVKNPFLIGLFVVELICRYIRTIYTENDS